jgi:DNA-binding NtrC family response regulator
MATEHQTRTLHRASITVEPLSVILRPKSPAQPAMLRLEGGTRTIGSGSRCDLVIDDATVSRAHIQVTLVPEGVLVEDLGSRNGTFYLGQRISKAVLVPGTQILLGKSPLSIDLDAEHLTSGPTVHGGSFRGMIGESGAMRRLYTTISRIDGSLFPILLSGETGVGKELVARALHEGSRVSLGPFVTVNCAVAPPTDADYIAADGGTLFLDEVGDLSPEVQIAMLRVLERGEVAADGYPRKVTVRVIAAAHRDLAALVASGKFRRDLYFRLAVVAIPVPALRERKEDIPSLARCFARQEGAADLDADVIEDLSAREYPGNVRELRNAVASYVALGTLSAPTADQPLNESEQLAPRYDTPYLAQRDALVDAFTRKYLTTLMAQTAGNQTEAARIAGLDRTYLGRLLAKMGMSRPR